MEPPLYDEKKIAKKMNVAIEDMRYARQILDATPKAKAWTTHKQAIVYTRAGLADLLELLVGPPGSGPDPASFDDCRVQENQDGFEDLEVVRKCPNRILVEARRSNGQVVNVQVKTNVNFMPGMKLPASLPAGATTWKHEGRCPRTKGRY